MTSNNTPSSNKNKELHNRLTILEKFIELKSNECAYYRTKVHLMQMSSSKNNKCSSSEDISQSNSNDHRYRKDIDNKIYAQNQNYYEEISSHSKQKSSLTKDENLLEQINKYLSQFSPNVAQDKDIQCNEDDFHSIASPHTILKIRLPHRFVKSLLAQQNRLSTPKLKVHLSSELLNKLSQSIHSSFKTPNKIQFTIQSQFGKIAACINHELALDATSKPSHFVHL